MKKIIISLLIAVQMLTLCACDSTDDIQGNVTDNTASETATEFSLGKTEGLVYENEFIGIGCRLDQDWHFYSDEEIKELNNITEDIASEEYQELMKDATVICDMYAVGSDQSSINVNLEKVNPVLLLAMDIVENYEAAIPGLKETFESMGYTNVVNTITTVEIDGKEVDAMRSTAEFVDMPIYQTAFAKKCNGYLVTVTVMSMYEDKTQQLLDNFYWIE